MKNTLRRMAGGLAILAAVSGLGGLSAAEESQPRLPIHYVGFLNDFTPSTVKNGPYEMRGKWTLDLDPRRGSSRFTAEMDMETSDYGVTNNVVDPAIPTSRGAHTHHILMTDGKINTVDWATICPAFIPALPAASHGFVITGSAYITVNGGMTPFANPSPMTLCVMGGELVQFSNITILMGTPASGHFGTFPIHGVILRCAGPWEFESKDCTQIPD